VITGNHVANFAEINQLLLDNGAELRVGGVQELADKVCRLLADPEHRRHMGQAGKQVVERNRGSTDRIMQLIGDTIPA
jgi:3-deoxy-D-manno-octulosonic-acid transferase